MSSLDWNRKNYDIRIILFYFIHQHQFDSLRLHHHHQQQRQQYHRHHHHHHRDHLHNEDDFDDDDGVVVDVRCAKRR